MRHYLLASTRLSRLPIAFDPIGMAIAPPGSVNMGMIAALIDAAKSAGAVNVQSTEKDLSARDVSSAAMVPYWDLTDDIISGYQTVKARGTRYLPKFPRETQDNYDGRLALTKMTNVFRDICETLASKPFEEEISLVTEKDKELPQDITDFIEDVDGAGNNITSFAGGHFFQGIVSTIDWIYVDYPKKDPSVRTQADAKIKNVRPFWSRVLGRNVLEVVSQMIGGEETLVYMRILEPGNPNHIRVFDRDISGAVQWALFEEKIDQTTGKKIFIMVDSGDISIGIIPLSPFITGRRDGRAWKFEPALNDAADLQIELYQQESGLKFAKTMTAYPMLAANGIKAPKGADNKPLPLAVGPNVVLYSEPDGQGNSGTWAYVSPDAACLTFLQGDIEKTMDQLRELGRQPLTAQSSNLTVITTAYAAGKSKSTVGAWALRLKDALENALKMTCMWLDITPETYDPKVRVYDEFDDFQNDQAADLTALQTMRASRDLSQRTYWREMQRRTVLSDEFNPEEEEEALLLEVPDPNENVIDDGAGNHPNGAPKYDGNGVPLDPKGNPLPPGKDHPPPPLPTAKVAKKPLKKIKRKAAPPVKA